MQIGNFREIILNTIRLYSWLYRLAMCIYIPKSVPFVCIHSTMYIHALCLWKLHSCVCFCAYACLCFLFSIFLFSIFLFSIPLSYFEVAVYNRLTNSVPSHIISFDTTKSSGKFWWHGKIALYVWPSFPQHHHNLHNLTTSVRCETPGRHARMLG